MSKKSKSFNFAPLPENAAEQTAAETAADLEQADFITSDENEIEVNSLGEETAQPKSVKPDKKPGKLSRLSVMLGESRFVSFFTVLSTVLYGVWTVTYVICVICRDSMLSQAAMQQAAQGIANFRLEITSPMFGLLRFFIYLLPVISLLWAIGSSKADKKGKIICDKKLMIIALCVVAVAGIVTVFDVATAHMLF